MSQRYKGRIVRWIGAFRGRDMTLSDLLDKEITRCDREVAATLEGDRVEDEDSFEIIWKEVSTESIRFQEFPKQLLKEDPQQEDTSQLAWRHAKWDGEAGSWEWSDCDETTLKRVDHQVWVHADDQLTLLTEKEIKKLPNRHWVVLPNAGYHVAICSHPCERIAMELANAVCRNDKGFEPEYPNWNRAIFHSLEYVYSKTIFRGHQVYSGSGIIRPTVGLWLSDKSVTKYFVTDVWSEKDDQNPGRLHPTHRAAKSNSDYGHAELFCRPYQGWIKGIVTRAHPSRLLAHVRNAVLTASEKYNIPIFYPTKNGWKKV